MLGTLGPRPLGRGCGFPTGNMLLRHMCYYTKFGHFTSNHIGVSRVPKILETLGSRPFGMWVVVTP